MPVPNFQPFPLLYTERLILRALKKEDETAIYALQSNPHNAQYIDRPLMQNSAEAQQFIQKITAGVEANKWIYWAIRLKDDDQLIGTICLWNFSQDHTMAEAGYELSPDAQGKGLMQEALKCVLDYGFSQLDLHEIEAYTHTENAASIKLLEKYQFNQKTIIHEEHASRGEWVDMAVYVLKSP